MEISREQLQSLELDTDDQRLEAALEYGLMLVPGSEAQSPGVVRSTDKDRLSPVADPTE